MGKRLYLKLTDTELDILKKAMKKTGKPSYRKMIICLGNSDYISELCYLSLLERNLRKISINLNQIIRKARGFGFVGKGFDIIGKLLDSSISAVSQEMQSARNIFSHGSSEKKEVDIRMAVAEKELMKKTKTALHFRTYASLVLFLCQSVNMNVPYRDLSDQYYRSVPIGARINEVARAFNRGEAASVDVLRSLLESLHDLLSSLGEKVIGDVINVPKH